MNKRIAFIMVVVIMAGGWLSACDREPTTAPPTVQYGVDPCHVCKMIISDERYASALIVDDNGVTEKYKFDDIGCMLDARKIVSGEILAAYVREYNDKTWVEAQQAEYVYSTQLHTPMAFGVAAFDSRAEAVAMERETDGEMLTFEQVHARFLAGDLTIDPSGGTSKARGEDHSDSSSDTPTVESLQARYTTKQCTLKHLDDPVMVALQAPTTPKVGKQPFELLVFQVDDSDTLRPFDPAEVHIEPDMPAMGHGSSGNEQPGVDKPGHYRGMVNFTMPGEWVVHVTIQHKTSTATVDFAFEVTQ